MSRDLVLTVVFWPKCECSVFASNIIVLRSQVNKGGEKEIIKENKQTQLRKHTRTKKKLKKKKLKKTKEGSGSLPTRHVEVDRRIRAGSIVGFGKRPHNHRL